MKNKDNWSRLLDIEANIEKDNEIVYCIVLHKKCQELINTNVVVKTKIKTMKENYNIEKIIHEVLHRYLH